MRNRLQKFSYILIYLIMVIGIFPQITYANETIIQDENIPSDWAKEEISKAIEIKLIPRKIQKEYKNSITREEFSELSVRLYEALIGKEAILQGENHNNTFTDTNNEKVLLAYELGIVQGKGDGRFAPKDFVTREEISVMLYRTLQSAKPNYDYLDIYQYIFSDYDSISTWAREAVGYLYGIEVINGIGGNRFNPKGNTSREEAIVLVKRMHDKVISPEGTPRDKIVVSRGITNRQDSVLKLKLQNLIAQEMGKPYRWGGIGPDGYDCSGLVYSIYGKLGISLPRTSRSQSAVGTYVAKEDLTYGDLVFFARDGRNINHVGIYIGNGEFVHAPQSGDVVKITTLMSGYYANSYYTARRIIP